MSEKLAVAGGRQFGRGRVRAPACQRASRLAVVCGGALLCLVGGCAAPGADTPKTPLARGVDTIVQPFYPQFGAVAVKNVRPDYQAPMIKTTKTWDLAKLARPTEVEARLEAGDLLEISCSDLVKESKKETFPVHIQTDGTIILPLLSQRVTVGSLTAGEAERAIRTAYAAAGMIRQPQVTCRTLEHKTCTIYVIGAVQKPGVYELQSDECDPLRAIVAAGGVNDEASSVVEVRRAGMGNITKGTSANPAHTVSAKTPLPLTLPEPTRDPAAGPGDGICRFDLTKNSQGNPEQLRLNNGDIVNVEPKKLLPVYVAGSVNHPGEFPMPRDRDLRVLEAVGLAGGVFTLSEPTVALIIRRPRDKNAMVIHVDLTRASKHPDENLRLMEGDVVSIMEDAASRTRQVIRTLLNLGLGVPIPL